MPPHSSTSRVEAILKDAPLMPLGPGSPQRAVEPTLRLLSHADLSGGGPVVNADMADCCLAAMWLRFDFLDESHTISQAISSTSGSYWHGMMHRREPDFGNAKYWFRRVGQHAVFPTLAIQADQTADSLATPASIWPRNQPWDPYRFIDVCERAYRRHDHEPFCRTVANQEWQILFDYCRQQATSERHTAR